MLLKGQNLLDVRTLKNESLKDGDRLWQKNLSFELGDGKDDELNVTTWSEVDNIGG